MKKLFYTFGAALVMLASVSCEKKDAVNGGQSSGEKVERTFYATSDGTEKTTVKEDGKTVIWSPEDAIKVFSADNTYGDECGISTGAGTTYAEFTGQCSGEGPWTAVYPSSLCHWNGMDENGNVKLNMPKTQKYAEKTFASGAMPCVAYSETTELSFKHSFGVLKLSLKGSGSVLNIQVTDKNGKKLNGYFEVNPSEGKIAATKYDTDDDYSSSTLILNCGESGVALNAGIATEFWIVVPEGAFAGGFDVLITSTDYKYAKLSTQNANTIKAGQITPMPEQTISFQCACGSSDATVTYSAEGSTGYAYPLASIGGQCWMAENVKETVYDTESEGFGKSMTYGYGRSEELGTTSWYTEIKYDDVWRDMPEDMTMDIFNKLGLLYSWAAAVGIDDETSIPEDYNQNKRQGICPNGFRLPTYADMDELGRTAVGEYFEEIGMFPFGYPKHLLSEQGWGDMAGSDPERIPDNLTGFSALPSGTYYGTSYDWFGISLYAWSSQRGVTPYTWDENAANILFVENGQLSWLQYGDGGVALSVRCIKDN